MKNTLLVTISFLAFIFLSCKTDTSNTKTVKETQESPKYAIVIHGGAGTILKKNMSEEMEKKYIQALTTAIEIGENILNNGGTAIDAVEKTIWSLEDSELFNAGRGAVFTNEGLNEHDASIMEGDGMNAGATGGTQTIKHPISAARAVLEKSNHVMLTGKGAEKFAEQIGLELVDPSYFKTERRWNALQRILKEEVGNKSNLSELSENKHGTVGCVALDQNGNIVAGTSTGGMTNKRFNRIGDTPIIGAGTYAKNQTCGVSCTGHGEYFIRYAIAHDVSARMEYLGEDLNTAANFVIHKTLKNSGGTGGLIALDKYGNIATPFNTEGMYRAYAKPGVKEIKIYKD